jgi:hypothetical protein
MILKNENNLRYNYNTGEIEHALNIQSWTGIAEPIKWLIMGWTNKDQIPAKPGSHSAS